MKMMTKSVLIAALAMVSFELVAQDNNTDAHQVVISIPEVALLDIETTAANTTVTLGPAAPTEAGLPLDFSGSTNNALWLNYSSIVGGAELTRTVKGQITAGTVPSGMQLKVAIAADAAQGDGTVGTPEAGTVDLTDGTEKTVISGIGSCYTGDGASKGHNLTYSLVMQSAGGGSYDDIRWQSNQNLTVTYTLSDI